jgi:hypothetical protein
MLFVVLTRLAHAVSLDLAQDCRGTWAQLFDRSASKQVAQKVSHCGRLGDQGTIAIPQILSVSVDV